MKDHAHGGGGRFQTTQWSLVARAGAAIDPDEQRAALDVLLKRYLPALHAHLLARGYRPQDAEDLVQRFVAERVIERNLLGRADRDRGRFRAFLATSLDRFAANARRAAAAAKRSPAGGRPPVPLDADAGVDPADPAAAAPGARGSTDAFDVAWARESLAEALRRTRDGCLADGRADLWDVLDARVLAPALADVEPVSYDALAARHGYGSWKRATNMLVTAKRRFEQALRAVVAEHAADDDELERELAALGTALAAAPRSERGDDGDGDDAAGPVPVIV